MQLQETYTTNDMTQTFKMSPSTLSRRLKEARAGRIKFPLPIQTGPKKSLRWSAESVRQFLQNGNDTPTSPTPQTESAKSRQMRHALAMSSLARKGIKTAQKMKGQFYESKKITTENEQGRRNPIPYIEERRASR